MSGSVEGFTASTDLVIGIANDSRRRGHRRSGHPILVDGRGRGHVLLGMDLTTNGGTIEPSFLLRVAKVRRLIESRTNKMNSVNVIHASAPSSHSNWISTLIVFWGENWREERGRGTTYELIKTVKTQRQDEMIPERTRWMTRNWREYLLELGLPKCSIINSEVKFYITFKNMTTTLVRFRCSNWRRYHDDDDGTRSVVARVERRGNAATCWRTHVYHALHDHLPV